MGNDQRELIQDSMQPMFTIYHGADFWQKPVDHERASRLPIGIKESEWAYRPPEPVVWPGLPDLADLVFEMGADAGFDFAREVMAGYRPSSHCLRTRQLDSACEEDNPVPILPISDHVVSPNQPKSKRFFEMGEFLAAIKPEPYVKVAVIGSGGLPISR